MDWKVTHGQTELARALIGSEVALMLWEMPPDRVGRIRLAAGNPVKLVNAIVNNRWLLLVE